MEAEGSFTHSQQPVTCPYPEFDQSILCSLHFLTIHFNIILPFTLGSSKWYLSLRFSPTKLFMHLSLSPMWASCPTNLIFLDLITRKILGEMYSSLSSSLCSFLPYPLTSSLLGPNILLSTLFSNTLSLRSYLNVSDQVSHPQKTTGEIIVFWLSENNSGFYVSTHTKESQKTGIWYNLLNCATCYVHGNWRLGSLTALNYHCLHTKNTSSRFVRNVVKYA